MKSTFKKTPFLILLVFAVSASAGEQTDCNVKLSELRPGAKVTFTINKDIDVDVRFGKAIKMSYAQGDVNEIGCFPIFKTSVNKHLRYNKNSDLKIVAVRTGQPHVLPTIFDVQGSQNIDKIACTGHSLSFGSYKDAVIKPTCPRITSATDQVRSTKFSADQLEKSGESGGNTAGTSGQPAVETSTP